MKSFYKRLGAFSLLTFILALVFTPLVALAQDATAAEAAVDPTKLVAALFEKVMSGEWAAVAAVVLTLLTWLSRQKKSPLHGWILKVSRGYWDIKKDRGGAILVLVLGLAGALLTALTSGAPITTALILTAVKESVMSAGGYVLVKKILFPADEESAQSTEDAAVKEAKLAAVAGIHTAPTPPGGTDTNNSPLNQ